MHKIAPGVYSETYREIVFTISIYRPDFVWLSEYIYPLIGNWSYTINGITYPVPEGITRKQTGRLARRAIDASYRR